MNGTFIKSKKWLVSQRAAVELRKGARMEVEVGVGGEASVLLHGLMDEYGARTRCDGGRQYE